MGTTLDVLQEKVRRGLGGRDSSGDTSIITDAINFASVAGALMFDPPELRKDESLTLGVGVTSLDLSSSIGTSFLNPISLYNSTDSIPMWYIPPELWNVWVSPSEDVVKYFTMKGNTAHFKATPDAEKTLGIYYRSYPTALSESTDQLDYSGRDGFVVMTAIAVAWEFLEEGESADGCFKAAESLGMPQMIAAQAYAKIKGEPSGNSAQ